MIRNLSFLTLSLIIFSTALFAQSAKLNDLKSDEAPKFVNMVDEHSSFFTDFKNRQTVINRINKGAVSTPLDLIIDNWDWPSNQFTPPHSFMFDLLGDGTLYPLTIETGNTLLNAGGTAERYANFAFADDFGSSSYLVYGTNSTGNPVRTGWNSHLILDEANGKVYISIYDFLNSNGLINNHLWEVDLLDDPTVAVQLTDSSTALDGGWPRIALDGNGTFWMTLDLGTKLGCGVAISVDGGQTFNLIDSVGSNDASFWATAFGNDFGLMASPEAEKISFFTKATRGGSLAGLGIATQGTANRDSASGVYHWYSTDGGNSWAGEWVMLEGDPVIVDRPNYEPAFISYSTASYVVDPTGVSHFVMGVGPNSAGIVGADTINVFPVLYWNDVDKDWLPLEIPAVEVFDHSTTLGWGNIPAARPIVKTDPSGQVVVAMWNRLQFSGAPGASSVNIFSAAGETDRYHYDVVYAYSEDFGATWSEPMIAASSSGNSYVYPMIAEVETEGVNATVHFTYLWDKVPGSFVVGQNSKSVDNAYIYNTVNFTLTDPVSVDDPELLVTDFRLEQNYPNPFNPSTTIKYTVAERSNVAIKVFDILGKEISLLENTVKEAGSYEVTFDASNLASGMYVYSITAGNFTSSKKMMLLK